MYRKPETIAAVCGVSLETARRWRRLGRCPEPARRLLAVANDLGAISEAWAGWRIADGLIYSPEGLTATPGEVAALWYYRQLAAEVCRRRRNPDDNVRVMVPDRLRLR